MDFSPSQLLAMYVSNLPWNLFLTSTALHAIALITSPLQAVYKWWRRQSSDSDTCVPYIFAMIGSSLWWRYSVFLRDTKLILLQSYALFMQCFFLFSLLYYRSKKRRLTRLVGLIVFVLLCLFYYVGNLSEEDGKELMGQMASTAQIVGSFICPWLIYKAVTSKCIDFVPMAPVAFTWVMEIHAIIYSVGIDDFYMMTIIYFLFAIFVLSAASEEAMASKLLTLPLRVVYITVPNREVGMKISKAVVEKKLAACVNIVPGITSVYEWENKVNIDEELLLIIKTQESSLEKLHEEVSSIHPYDTPEFISIPIDHASEKYGKWVMEQTTQKTRDET